MNETHGGFISSIKKCISMTQKNFSSVEFYDSLEEKIPITDISIEFEGQYHSIPSSYVWDYSFHEKYGYCHVLDIHKFQEFPNIKLDPEEVLPTLFFKFREDISYSWAFLMFHNRNDIPDAVNMHPYAYIHTDNGKQLHILFSKMIERNVSTKKRPCYRSYPRTCRERKLYWKIMEKFNCHVPFLYSGYHLETYFKRALVNCTDDDLKTIMEFWESEKTSCKLGQMCYTEKYSFLVEKFDISYRSNKSEVLVSLKENLVKHRETYVNYNFQSLVSEIGGILGITLGASAFSLVQVLFQKSQLHLKLNCAK